MLSLIICAGALIGLVGVGACCADSKVRSSYEYHRYMERNKKAPPTIEDWTRYL